MSNQPIKLFIVDDHQIVIDGLCSLLEDNTGFKILGSTTKSNEALAIIKNNPPDILLTDVMMPGMSGQQLAKAVRNSLPQVKILALSMSGQGDIVNEMINDADINGYALKNISKEELNKALIKIAGGGIFFSDEVLVELEKESRIKRENTDVLPVSWK
jgi:two-component system, NarL family, nitrate/nitrite response regulator NarL